MVKSLFKWSPSSTVRVTDHGYFENCMNSSRFVSEVSTYHTAGFVVKKIQPQKFEKFTVIVVNNSSTHKNTLTADIKNRSDLTKPSFDVEIILYVMLPKIYLGDTNQIYAINPYDFYF